MSEYLTTGEAAAILGVSKPTVVRAIQRGMLRPALVTPGQHRRFRREEVLAFRARILGNPDPVEVGIPGRRTPLHPAGEVELPTALSAG